MLQAEEKILSLLSQRKMKELRLHLSFSSLKIYIYIILAGLSSLLAFLLFQKSLPINKQQTKEYYQALQTAKLEVFNLEKDLIKFQYFPIQFTEILSLQLIKTQTAFNKLTDIPDFYSPVQQNILNNKLETQLLLLTSKSTVVEQIQNAHAQLEVACQAIFTLNKELANNPSILSDNLVVNSQLFSLVEELLTEAVVTCQTANQTLSPSFKNKITKLELLLQLKSTDNINKNLFAFDSLINYLKTITNQKQILQDLFKEIQLSELEDKLTILEIEYLEQYQAASVQVNKYRLISALLIFIIIIVIAYKIINNLARTNRSIVKVLEGFTQELESKVEQRTAQLETSIQNTEAALAQAQNANKAKSRFLANMSHELRTPLNAILGFTQLMSRDSTIGKEQQENLQIINRSGEHLLRLINDILEMSKIEVGQITLNESKFDLYAMLKSLEEMLRLKARAKNLNLIFNIDDNVPNYIYTDEGKLRQIIINLLGNALKFTEQGSITLTVKLQKNSHPIKDKLYFIFTDIYSLFFAVEDTGPGIEPEEMQLLFCPFEQTKIGRISNEGTGLGLSICQKFVDLMGGELTVESKVGKGSIFSFNILVKIQDLAIADNDKEAELLNRKIISIAPGQKEYRILAVDDVPASRLLLKKLLSEIGFIVKEAGNGMEAVQVWQEWHPDLIFMDMRMPVMDGYEATKQIKSQPQGDKTIIIALTASAFEEERVIILAAGCDDFMRKPFYQTELLEKIAHYLNINYLYQESVEPLATKQLYQAELIPENLAVMSLEWRSQLYEAAAKVDNQEILQLLAEIPSEYQSLAQGLEDLVEQFRCDKIIDLTQAVK
ncbi:histidine kinase [Chondrocystis sp. NIES-4102]|nr:histidine kinase [Chondrocystis sp. NIES-4102]